MRRNAVCMLTFVLYLMAVVAACFAQETADARDSILSARNWGFLQADIALNQPMSFAAAGNGGNCNGCEWVATQGNIISDTPEQFFSVLNVKEKRQQNSYNNVARNSGGSPEEATALGRVEAAGEPITENNWMNHPEISEVRSLYQKINESKDVGDLDLTERQFEDCEPYEDNVRTLYIDRNGKPRIYYYKGGSEDSFVERELYYDESGKLRFAFIVANAINGTQLEHRVYFSKEGKKIWEIQKRLQGPGYTFPAEWPDAELIHNPLQAFNDWSPCTEVK